MPCRWRAPWCPAGSGCLEITLRTPAGRDAAAAIVAEVPEAVVGIGTVLTPQDLARSRELGARFALSPGATPELLDAAAESDLPFMPGVATASELMMALARGFDTVKFFPAVPAGGIAALKALAGPVPAGPLLPDRRRERGQRGRVACAARTSSWSAAPGSPQLARSAPARGIGLRERARRAASLRADDQRGGAATTDERPRRRPK